LWDKYFGPLAARARRRLAGVPGRAADEQDVALSAFDSFCRGAERGRFPRLNGRDDLWQLLVVIADRKAIDLARYERRQRRGGGKVLDEAALRAEGAAAEDAPLGRAVSPEPSPEAALRSAEECRRLLDLLEDADQRQTALLRMEGYTVEEIAARLGRVPRTVKRWLRLIRQTWEQELGP
jgi:RNA polymerase sigma factor (sigma-70 family)